MQLIRGLLNIKQIHKSCVVTVGNFDGIHKGHQRILNTTKNTALSLSAPSIAIFFEPQPADFFFERSTPVRLMSFRDKVEGLSKFVDYVLCVKFNLGFASLSAKDFLNKILKDTLDAKVLVVGDDFKFGKDRQGHFSWLQQECNILGIKVMKIDSVLIKSMRISSTNIKSFLQRSDLHSAFEMMGRPYSVSGKVVKGNQIASNVIKVPTANIDLSKRQIPLQGVFYVQVHLQDGQVKNGIANVGYKPSFSNDNIQHLEVHILNFSGRLYRKRIKVVFLKKIRDERKFSDIEDLKAQIKKDILVAMSLCN